MAKAPVPCKADGRFFFDGKRKLGNFQSNRDASEQKHLGATGALDSRLRALLSGINFQELAKKLAVIGFAG